jgi:asparagine synthase (glutamine-hydrolysing)
MCGFVITKDKKNINHYLSMISHRGLKPYSSTCENGSFALGHFALPFVSLDPNLSVQPINGRTVFVGEIFNFNQLTDKTFSTDAYFMDYVFHQDIRLLKESYKWDGFWSGGTIISDKLVLISDYLSQKPVYYRTDMEAACSEIAPLVEMGDCTRDEVFLSNVIKWGYSPDGRTPWEQIKQLEAGSVYIDGKIESYFDWDRVTTYGLFDMMYDAVASRLQGQREVALLLSGGLDSSIVYGLAKQIKESITVLHVENEEKEWANLVHSFHGGNDTLECIDLGGITEARSIFYHQTPVDLGSVRPQLAMAERINSLGLNCVLTGDGADELFGGYRRAKDYDSQQSDVFSELPYYHCPRLDRTMMRYTIELRTPFLRSNIVKYALNLPYEARNGTKKVLMHEFKDIVPPEVLFRSKRPLKSNEIRTDPMKNRLLNDTIWRLITS